MELASMLAEEPFSDRAGIVSPVIGAFLRTYNDGLDDERRQDLYPIASLVVGTAAGRRLEDGDGLELHHQMLLLVQDGKLFRAPVANPQAILDVGTGTGAWAVDVADEFPSAQVIGTDLSPIQPSWVPSNCRFELDDVTLPWIYEENFFDLIHIRCLMGSIEDWTKLYSEAYRCLKPGGWLEHTDFTVHITSDDGSVPEDSVYATWNRVFAETGERTGKTFSVNDGQMARCMKDAGFSGPINVKDYKLPMGTWPAERKWKEIGGINLVSCDYGLEGYALYSAINVLGWAPEDVQELCERMRTAFRTPTWHAHFPCTTVWTQKPPET